MKLGADFSENFISRRGARGGMQTGSYPRPEKKPKFGMAPIKNFAPINRTNPV